MHDAASVRRGKRRSNRHRELERFPKRQRATL